MRRMYTEAGADVMHDVHPEAGARASVTGWVSRHEVQVMAVVPSVGTPASCVAGLLWGLLMVVLAKARVFRLQLTSV